MITVLNENEWFPSLKDAIESRHIKTFRTSKTAQEAAINFGWGTRVCRIDRRFERVWVVASLDFQPTSENGIEFQTLRIPMLRYETREDNIKYQPVLILRKPYKKD